MSLTVFGESNRHIHDVQVWRTTSIQCLNTQVATVQDCHAIVYAGSSNSSIIFNTCRVTGNSVWCIRIRVPNPYPDRTYCSVLHIKYDIGYSLLYLHINNEPRKIVQDSIKRSVEIVIQKIFIWRVWPCWRWCDDKWIRADVCYWNKFWMLIKLMKGSILF